MILLQSENKLVTFNSQIVESKCIYIYHNILKGNIVLSIKKKTLINETKQQ